MKILFEVHGDEEAYDKALNEAKSLGYTPTGDNRTGGLEYGDNNWGSTILVGVEVEEQFINCTPHPININNKTIKSFANIRLSENKTLIDNINGVEIYSVNMGELMDGEYKLYGNYSLTTMLKYYNFNIIVSAMVAPVLKEKYPNIRVFSPLDLVRDEQGRVVGCKSLREWR